MDEERGMNEEALWPGKVRKPLRVWEATNTESLGLEEAPVISAQKYLLKYDAIEEQIYCQQQLWRTEQLCMEVLWVKLHMYFNPKLLSWLCHEYKVMSVPF